MPTNKILTPLLSDNYFHVFNRGNDGDRIFYTKSNYHYFLEKYWFYLGPYVETYAYCLIENHFHLLIKVNSSDNKNYHLEVSHQFRKLFQSYALSINKQEGRSGSLFRKQFRRIRVSDFDYLKRLVFYIHFNPQKHQLVQNFRTYPYSSYKTIIDGSKERLVNVESVISWFNDNEDFIHYHDAMHDERKLKTVSLEDD